MPKIYTKIKNNIFDDNKDSDRKITTTHDTVYMHRANMAKSRQLATTTSNNKIGINLERGKTLQHGDVLQSEDDKELPIIIKQMPEKVIALKFMHKNDKENYLSRMLIGHTIGNMHRPIAIKNNKEVLFPIQDDTELEMFERKFSKITSEIEMNILEEIFVPHVEANVHGHQ